VAVVRKMPQTAKVVPPPPEGAAKPRLQWRRTSKEGVTTLSANLYSTVTDCTSRGAHMWPLGLTTAPGWNGFAHTM